MASVTRKIGSSGKLSPYWQAKFKSLDGQAVWRSTKLENEKKALAIAERWERAAKLAAAWELNQERCKQILDQVNEISKSPATLKSTRELLGELLQHSIGENFKGQNLQFFAAEWLNGRSTATAPATHEKYASVVTRFITFLPENRRSSSVASISIGEIERFRNAEIKSGKTSSTVNTEIVILRALFNHARRQGIATNNPAEGVELMPGDGEERVPFSDQQIRDLLNVASPEWRGMILFGAYAGLRIGDAAKLRWSNIDLEARTLTYQPAKTARRKKPSERTVRIWMHDALVGYLETLPVSDDPHATLFPSLIDQCTGGERGYSKTFSRLMEEAAVRGPAGLAKGGQGRRFNPLTFHSLRHTFISRLANLEVSSDLRKELVGHSSDAIHDRYTHLDISLQQVALNKLADLT